MFDGCVHRAVAKIFFTVRDDGNIRLIRQYCGLPEIGKIIESRRLNFVNKVWTIDFYLLYFSSDLIA